PAHEHRAHGDGHAGPREDEHDPLEAPHHAEVGVVEDAQHVVPQMLSRSRRGLSVRRLSNSARDMNRAVIRLATMPTLSVTANPLTVPVPKSRSAMPAMKVVTWLSMMVPNALSNPACTAVFTVRPNVSSSRMRSNTRTLAST